MDEFKGRSIVIVKRLLLIVLLLAGCSAQVNKGLIVTLTTTKTEIQAFEPVTFTATILFDDEKVVDGADIAIEFIDPNGVSIGSVTPTNLGDGRYFVETSFDALGTYTIISHVDYEGLHEMPTVEVELK